ncbi:hypothetical protein BASA81_006514 [Batrachochytrium salamandrivorans]|nr:hypothetical protein BASA81_006514 [Batrachochytrium salamandrivorans]
MFAPILLLLLGIGASASDPNRPHYDPIIFDSENRLAKFAQSAVAAAILVVSLLMLMVGCCCFSKSKASGSAPSLTKIKRLSLVVAYLSSRVWFTTWALPFTCALVNALALFSFVWSIRIYRAALREAAFPQSDFVRRASTHYKYLAICALLYVVSMFASGAELAAKYVLEYGLCPRAIYGAVNCAWTKELFARFGVWAVVVAFVLACLVFSLARNLWDVASKLQTGVAVEEGFQDLEIVQTATIHHQDESSDWNTGKPVGGLSQI